MGQINTYYFALEPFSRLTLEMARYPGSSMAGRNPSAQTESRRRRDANSIMHLRKINRDRSLYGNGRLEVVLVVLLPWRRLRSVLSSM